jgi:peroxiredoxin
LLSDAERTVGEAYQAARPPEEGKPPRGALRVSYLIDPDGNIARPYLVTDTAGHAAEVLADLESLGA